MIVYGLSPRHLVFHFFALARSDVLPVVHVARVLLANSLPALIHSYFAERVHLHECLRHSEAIVVDLSYNKSKSV